MVTVGIRKYLKLKLCKQPFSQLALKYYMNFAYYFASEKFASDLWLDGGFRRVLQFAPTFTTG